MSTEIPPEIPRILPSNFKLFATKRWNSPVAVREFARPKRGIVGWYEFSDRGVSYPYRRLENEWHLDEALFKCPGGVKNGHSLNPRPQRKKNPRPAFVGPSH